MSVTKALLVTFLIAVVVLLERLFPFAVFSKKTPGKLIHIFEKYIPPIVMLGLLVYSLRDTRFTSIDMWVPQIVAILFTIASYVWKKNTLISIFGGTIIYMVLIRVL